MSKKHFIALADAIANHNRYNPNDQFSESQIQTLAQFCRGQNYAFMSDRWKSYIKGECGSNGGKVAS